MTIIAALQGGAGKRDYACFMTSLPRPSESPDVVRCSGVHELHPARYHPARHHPARHDPARYDPAPAPAPAGTGRQYHHLAGESGARRGRLRSAHRGGAGLRGARDMASVNQVGRERYEHGLERDGDRNVVYHLRCSRARSGEAHGAARGARRYSGRSSALMRGGVASGGCGYARFGPLVRQLLTTILSTTSHNPSTSPHRCNGSAVANNFHISCG